jgi:hypothetical protein
MIRRQIDLDEESDRILSGLAQEYHGDLGEALAGRPAEWDSHIRRGR